MSYRFDEGALYTKTHEWVRRDGAEAVVGVTDYAQQKLSDVVFVDLPEAGREVKKDAAFAVIESVKAAEDIMAPLSGKVSAVNPRLAKSPELVNSDPFGQGWLVRIAPSDGGETASLMKPAEYKAYVETL